MTIVNAAAIEISTTLNSGERTVQKVVRNIVQLGKLRVQFRDFPVNTGA
jgi:hypothetical protein